MKLSPLALLVGIAGLSFSAAETVLCNASKQCPENLPCCSLYGECGTGSYCLGPCNPKFSFNTTSCAPAPICKSGDYTFNNLNGIVNNTAYLGDASAHDFVVNNQILSFDGNVLLTMSNGSTGTVLTSTRAIWYGKVSATFKTSRTQGVVSSFILMSGVRDEIDYEFIGSFLESAQTNYYWQEKLDYSHGRNVSLSDTFQNFHTYEIDWTPDSITWSIDGQPGRVLNKKDTLNATTNVYEYPQTPAFLQISLWPGGLASNPEGTINWAGGNVNWDSPDIHDPGYFYVTLKDVNINCYDPPSGTSASGSKAYVYKNSNAMEGDVEITDDDTVLGSFQAVGFDMKKGSDNELGVVSGSVPTGLGSGNNHSGSADSSDIPTASNVSISSKSSSSESLADASQISKSTAPPKVTSDSSKSSSTGNHDSAAASSSAAGGFQQGGGSSSSSSSAPVNKNTAFRLTMPLAFSFGALLFSSLVLA